MKDYKKVEQTVDVLNVRVSGCEGDVGFRFVYDWFI